VEPRAFTQDQKRRFGEYFTQKGIELKCPVCSGEEFAIETTIEGREAFYTHVGLTPTGGAVPMVVVMCENCTHIMLFHANRMGLQR
jgi:uncharacterized Zn finger protein